MKRITILIACTIFSMIVAPSCTKNSSVVTPLNSLPASSKTGQTVKSVKKLMNVLMYTQSAYEKHDEHEYAEGHILEFSTNWKLLKAINTAKIESALAFMHTALQTGDTTGQYLNLCTYILPKSAFLDAYPDSALVANPASFASFKSWFESTCITWMTGHQCPNIVENTGTSQYYMKIHCEAN